MTYCKRCYFRCAKISRECWSNCLSWHYFNIVCDIWRKKGRDLTHANDKSPYAHRKKSRKQHDNTKTPPKTLITQRLRTDLTRSVGVTAVTQRLWLNRLRALNLQVSMPLTNAKIFTLTCQKTAFYRRNDQQSVYKFVNV